MLISNKFYNQIVDLEKVLQKELPGEIAHLRMAPAHRDRLLTLSNGPEYARKSSVLILLSPDDKGEVCTTFIKRVEYEGVHSGQIAFPGGKYEEIDINLIETALREAEEEVGLKRESVSIIGQLSDLFVPPSNFIISPVLATIPFRPEFIPDCIEVDEVFTVPLNHFLNAEFTGEYDIPYRNGQTIRVPGYYYKNHLIWGATAMILNELLQLMVDAGLIKEE